MIIIRDHYFTYCIIKIKSVKNVSSSCSLLYPYEKLTVQHIKV